jgi:phosphoethanolamine N-methyltransferase
MQSNQSMDQRYTLHEIKRYEAIYGQHFISPGGEDTTRLFLGYVPLDQASKVLDVGCGIGGSAFYIAQTFRSEVDGIDLAPEMIRLAVERCRTLGLTEHLRFFEGNCLTFDYPRRDYSLIYSRDTFLHIADKQSLFRTLSSRLAPGGCLLFTDYVRGAAPASAEFSSYIQTYGYSLETIDGYRRILEETGFEVLRADDLRQLFIETHHRELNRLPNAGLSPEDVRYLTERWEQKIRRAEGREQGWALFLARWKAE